MKSPFKFLDSYEKEDRDRFFGRDKEIDALYEMVFQTKLILMYGASGVGKTSIIRCGLSNRFNTTQWMDLYVRRQEDINVSLMRTVMQQVRAISPDAPVTGNILKDLKTVYLYSFKPVYLIFDQFEELFILGTHDEQVAFFEFVKSVLRSELSCKLILSMREEYIAYLSECEEIVPSLFDNRIRVERMKRRELNEVLQGTLQAAHIAPPDEDTRDYILDVVTDRRTGVELAYLQVYLDRLWREAYRINPDHIAFDRKLVTAVGELGNVVRRFVDEQLAEMGRAMPEGKGGVPALILRELVTDDATKRVLNAPAIRALRETNDLEQEDIDFCLNAFERMRILRRMDD